MKDAKKYLEAMEGGKKAPPAKAESDEDPGETLGETAVRDFFKAGQAGDWKKALKALRSCYGGDE